MRIPIRATDNQTIPMKVDSGWITHQKMQHISLGIRRLYHLISSRVTTTSTEDLRRHRVPEQKLKGKPSSDYAEDKVFLRGRQCYEHKYTYKIDINNIIIK